MFWLELLLGVAVLLGIAAVVAGRGDSLDDAEVDTADAGLPSDRPVSAADVPGLRFPLAFRGYRMEPVDTALDRLAESLADAETRASAAEQLVVAAEQRATRAEERAGRAEERANKADERASRVEERATNVEEPAAKPEETATGAAPEPAREQDAPSGLPPWTPPPAAAGWTSPSVASAPAAATPAVATPSPAGSGEVADDGVLVAEQPPADAEDRPLSELEDAAAAAPGGAVAEDAAPADVVGDEPTADERAGQSRDAADDQ